MSSHEALPFDQLPPFPDTVPTAPLLKISLSKLLAHDAEEEERLWNACCDLGFFYLDLQPNDKATTVSNGTNGHTNWHTNGTNGHTASPQVNGESLLADADTLFHVASKFFALPVTEKQKYDFSSKGSYMGYKGYGSGVIDKAGTLDRNEFYNVAKDDIMNVSSEPLPAPELLQTEDIKELLRRYIESAHGIVRLVLAVLGKKLEMKRDTLEGLHRLDAAAGDQVRFIRAPPQPREDRRTALGEHSDFGSVTVLFNRLGGLQVRLPSTIPPIPPSSTSSPPDETAALTTKNWAYVRPLPGHAIINLGDALVKFTAGILRSNIHRVVSPPGAQGDAVRYSLVYFSRPEDDVLLRPLRDESKVIDEKCRVSGEKEEEPVKSKEWILRRGLGRRLGGKFEDSLGTESVRGAYM